MTITARPSIRPTRSTSRCRGGALLGGAAEQGGDAAHLGAHAGRGHHRPAPSPGHGRAAERHVGPVAERGQGRQGRAVLEHRLALARQRRLGHLQRGPPNQAPVGADGVAVAQDQHVAGDQLLGRDAHLLAVARDRRGRGGHPLQCGHRLLGLALLNKAEQAVAITMASNGTPWAPSSAQATTEITMAASSR
jgi:hypothetical protein